MRRLFLLTMAGIITVLGVVLIVGTLSKPMTFSSTDPVKPNPPVLHTNMVIHGSDVRETMDCEFDPPLKYVTLILNWYDTNEEMYADYILLADDPKHEEIWGWSSCVWQPDDRWAACDIFVVTPDYVHADMNVDTLGHEVLHAACGDYHD